MLDKFDREYIKKIIQQSFSGYFNSKPTTNSSLRQDSKLQYYQDKVSSGKDTLAERIEFEKLKLQERILKKLSIGKQTQKNIASTTKFVGNTVKNSIGFTRGSVDALIDDQVKNGVYNAFMYSNPLTAVIAEGLNLSRGFGTIAKGLGKGIKAGSSLLGKGANWTYQKLRQGSSAKITNAKLNLPMNLSSSNRSQENGTNGYITANKNLTYGGNNYIVAKQALFVDGTNYINVVGNSRNSSMLSGQYSLPDNSSSDGFSNNGNLLPQKNTRRVINKNDKESSNMITMKKGLDGIYQATQESNALLKIIKGRTILMAGALLLGVAAIAAIVYWLNNDGKELVRFIGNLSGKATREKKKAEKYITGGFNTLDATSLSSLSGELINKKLDEHPDKFTGIYSSKKGSPVNLKSYGQSLTKKLVDSMEYNVGELSPILAPWDGFIDAIHNNSTSFTITIESFDTKPKRITFDQVIHPRVTLFENVIKGQLLAFATNNFRIFSDNKSLDSVSNYADFINEQKDSNWQLTKDLNKKDTEESRQKREKYYGKLIQSQLDKGYRAKNKAEFYGRKVDEDSLTNLKPSLNVSNKNEITAKNNVNDLNKRYVRYADKEGNEVIRELSGNKIAPTNLAINNSSPIIFGQQDLFDINAANNSIITLA